MDFEESIGPGTALGVFEWVDLGEPPADGTADTETGSWASRADGGESSASVAPADEFLTLGADTFVFNADPPPELQASPGQAPTAAAGDDGATTALSGDLDVPEADDDAADAEVFPDWMEPSFDFRPTDVDGEPVADGQKTAAPPASLAASELDDLTGDFNPPPDEPEETPPTGDLIWPGDDELPETFIADDGSIVTVAELTQPDLLL